MGLFTLSNIDISETNRPIAIKFHVKHHWGRGNAALGFGPDRIRTLASMATGSSHRVIMGETIITTSVLIGSSSFLQVARTFLNA